MKYLIGDVTSKLPFKSESFDAIILGFILSNIIPASRREKASKEINRILKPGGLVWLNEGLVSPAYRKRSQLSRKFIGEVNTHFVFRSGVTNKAIKNYGQLKEAIENGEAERVCHQFLKKELKALFKGYGLEYEKEIENISPRSKSKLKSLVAVLRKPI